MSQGIQVFDASGNIVFDTNQVTGRLFGYQDLYGSGGVSFTVTDSRFSSGTPFCFVTNTGLFTSFPNVATPYWTTTLSGSTYTVSRTNYGSNESLVSSYYVGTLIYGVV